MSDTQVQVYHNVLNAQAIEELRKFFDQEDSLLDARPDFVSKRPLWASKGQAATWPQHYIESVLDNLFDDYKVDIVLFAKTDIRYPLHTDSGLGSDVYKLHRLILFPLTVTEPYGTPFFDNHWFGPQSKFTKQKVNWYQYNIPNKHKSTTYVENIVTLRSEIDENPSRWTDDFDITDDFKKMLDHLILSRNSKDRNQIINNYQGLTNVTSEEFPNDIREKYFDHVPLEDLQGMKFHSYQEWHVGSAIVWPRTMVHCMGPKSTGKSWILVHTYQDL